MKLNYKICQISDTHIRNLKYHKEYRIVFDKIYKSLREQKPDAIVHCGDLAHTKVHLSPEYFDLASDFLKNLADIAPLIIIPGNHDGNLRNTARQDAITPLVTALEHKHIHLLRDSGEYVWDSNIVFNVLSVFDPENWVKPTREDKINIALYHGSISGCETSLGWVMEHGENDVSIFEGHDYAMLGDIHKTNQILDDHGRVRYVGSTIQQGHAEELDKGYLLWTINSKDDWDVELFTFRNPKPFITIELTQKGRIPRNTKIPFGARVRVVANNKLPVETIRKATDVVRTRFKPESLTFLNRAGVSLSSSHTGDITEQNLRDVQVQQEFISDYLKDYEPSEELLKEVFSLNERFNKEAEENEEVARNVNWSLKHLEWDNLFNYGENNKLDFESNRGLVGIFGKNYSGKSSVVDSLLYTLYNSTSKNVRKNVNIINDYKQDGRGKVKIQVGTKLYTVERSSEKYERKLRGQVTTEARTDVKFTVKDLATGEEEILDATDRNKTDAKIRHTFGTMEDFLTTSMSSQLGALDFISEGSTRRKEILAKFLDLEFFERKFRLAKKESSDTKGYLKKLETFNLDADEEEIGNQQDEVLSLIEQKETACEGYEKELTKLNAELQDTEEKIDSVPEEIIDAKSVKSDIATSEIMIENIDRKIKGYEDKIQDSGDFLAKAEDVLLQFNEEELLDEASENKKLKKQLDELLSEAASLEKDLDRYNKRVGILEEIPCGDKFKTSCKFITNAFEAQELIPATNLSLAVTEEKSIAAKKKVEESTAQYTLEKIANTKTKILETQHTITSLQLQVSQEQQKRTSLTNKIEELRTKLDYYEENKEAIINAAMLQTYKKEIVTDINNTKSKCNKCREELLQLHKQEGSLQAQLAENHNKRAELEKTRREFSAYDLFMKCMHPNGIAFGIIKKKLPLINEAITQVLANVSDFGIYFEDNGRKLDIFIQHKGQEARPLELGSGAEKTLAAMAIRIALLNVSNMPKSDLFILDEPGTALDANNMEGFTRILDILREHFKTTLLITHIEGLKDSVQKVITVVQQDGFAHINQ
tara:strand:- start:7158 stop:10310 length:3153 start_codon:yes stop_codon:yes gene_type:complete